MLNRRSNYQVVVNEKSNYATRLSKRMSNASAAQRLRSLSSQFQLPSDTRACRKFKSGALKPLHLNLVKLNNRFQNNTKDNVVAQRLEEDMDKHRTTKKKNRKEENLYHHQHQYESHHDGSRKQRHAQKCASKNMEINDSTENFNTDENGASSISARIEDKIFAEKKTSFAQVFSFHALMLCPLITK